MTINIIENSEKRFKLSWYPVILARYALVESR